MSSFQVFNDERFNNVVTDTFLTNSSLNLPFEPDLDIPIFYGDKGKIAYNEEGNTIMFCTGTEWMNVGNGSVGTVTSVATGTGLTGGPITSTGTISLGNIFMGTAPVTYNYPSSVTVNQQGQITAISPGTGGGTGTVTSVATTSVFTVNGTVGGTITTTGTLGLAATGVNIALNPYMNPSSISVNASGQITAITAGSAPTNGTVTSVATTSVFTVNGTVGGTITTTGTLGLAATGVNIALNPYMNPSSISVNASGQITAITAGSAPTSGTVTSVATTSVFTVNGMIAGTITTTGTLGLAATGVNIALNPYMNPSSISVNASGQITAITAGSAPTNGTVTSVATTSVFTVNGTVGGTITTTGTLGLAATGVNIALNPYMNPSSISVNASGQITAITAGSAPTNGTVTSIVTTLDLTVNGVAAGTITTTGTLGLAATGVNPALNPYMNPSSISVNASGQITAITAGSAPSGTVTSVATTSVFTVNGTIAGTITTTGTLGLAATGVNPALNPYMNPSSISVNASGQITAITAGSAPTNGTVTSVATTSVFTVNGTVAGTITTTGTLGLAATGVNPALNPYMNPSSISVNASGQITAITAGSAPTNGTVTSIVTTSVFTVNGTAAGTITTTGTLGLAATGVNPALNPYMNPSSISVNASGQITAITAGSAPKRNGYFRCYNFSFYCKWNGCRNYHYHRYPWVSCNWC